MRLAVNTKPRIDSWVGDADPWCLPEALTSRELDLLSYLPTQLTRVEIAERMYLSANTVKFHLKNLYRKLEVESRDLAVVRADELGLVGGTLRRCECGSGWIVDPGPPTT